MCDTTRQNGGSGEKNAQVKILIYHLLMALRGVYKKTGIVDNPVHWYLKLIIDGAAMVQLNSLSFYH